jgi:hypothetical protein
VFDSLQALQVSSDCESAIMEERKPTADSSARAVGTAEPIRLWGFQGAILRVLRELFTTPRGWWLICICFAAIVQWPARIHMFPDGLSYLDIGSEASKGDLGALANSYWSPAYPALIGAALFLLQPSPASEVPVLQLVNTIIFILTLGAFTLFFRSWSRSIPEFEQASSRDKGLFTLFAFASFLWFTASLITIRLTTPDMLTAAMVFLLAGMGFRVSRADAGWRQFAGLGVLLGLGIYVKAALFPLAFAFIALLFISLARNSEIPRRRLLAFLTVTTGMCAVVAAPLIFCMSVQAGRFTAGDSGKLNYLWVVDRFKPPYTGWTGGTAPQYGTPLHPPRKLMENPTVLEFATPIAGTYPLWHSPGYWYVGAKPVFNLRMQLLALKVSFHEYAEIPIRAYGSDGFFAGAILLFVLGMMGKSKRPYPWRTSFWLPSWLLVACAMYGLVWAHWRYTAAFLLLLCLEIYRVLIFRVERRIAIGVCAIAVLIAMAPLSVAVERSLKITVRQHRHPADVDYVAAGKNLQHLELQEGDKLAFIGDVHHPYYARYARLRVVSQIQDADEFWRLNPTDARRVEDRLASIGVKALLAFDRPATTKESGWTDAGTVEGKPLSVLLLPPVTDFSH